MTRRDKLYENYEDALFELLMAEVSEAEGQRLLEESQRLNEDPEAGIPEALDQKCRKIMRRAFSKNRRHDASRVIRMVLNKAAVFALISLLLFTTAYALVPEVRAKTLNLLIEISDVATGLTFGGNTGDVTGVAFEGTFFGYHFPAAPKGFKVANKGSNDQSAWIRYENDKGALISLRIRKGCSTNVLNVDTEDADYVEQLLIHEYEGLLVTKGDTVSVVWGDLDRNVFVSIMGDRVEKSVVIDIANDVLPEE